MDWRQERWLVIDTETTGIDIEQDRIVELAAVWMLGGQEVERRGMLLCPGIPIPAEATAVHGISDADVAECPTLEAVAEAFLEHVRQAPVLVAYNWPFDAGILSHRCPGWDEAIEGKVILDPLVVVRFDTVGRYWRGQGRHRLEAVHERLLDGPPPGSAHRASTDAIMAGRVLWALREHLPADGADAARIVAEARAEQDRSFAAWKARQPPREP